MDSGCAPHIGEIYLCRRMRSLAYSRTCHALLAGGHAPAIARNVHAFSVFFYCYFREIPAAKIPCCTARISPKAIAAEFELARVQQACDVI